MNFLQRYLLASFRALIAIIPLMDSEGVIMNSTRVRASGARSWSIVCALASMMMPLAADGQDWQMSGNDLTNDRNQPHETLIDAGNVATLKPAWTFTTLGSVSATPLVTGGYVYFPDWGGGLHKLNARTGQVVWSHKVSEYTGWSDSVSRTTPVLADGVLVVGQQPQSFGAKHDSSYLLGLDPETGNFLWKVMLDKHPATIQSQSPVVHNGVIYIGTSSNEEHWALDTKFDCCSFVASMAAVELKTGRVIWQTPMVPKGYTGGAIWSSTPAIDPKRGVVYITTGNNYTTPKEVAECQESGKRDCLPIDDHIDSFVALDLKTGAIRWATRVVPFDTWNGNCFVNEPGLGSCPEPRGGDLDFGQGAMLYTATVNGKARDMLAAGQKSGMFWGIDRDSGKVVWGTQVGPGGQSGGTEWAPLLTASASTSPLATVLSRIGQCNLPELSPPAACGVLSIRLPARSFGRLPSPREAGRSVRSRLPMVSSTPARWIRRDTCARSTRPRARSCGPSRRAVQWLAVQQSPMAWSSGDRATSI